MRRLAVLVLCASALVTGVAIGIVLEWRAGERLTFPYRVSK